MNIRQSFAEQVFLNVLPFLLQADKALICKHYLQVPDIFWIALYKLIHSPALFHADIPSFHFSNCVKTLPKSSLWVHMEYQKSGL